MTTPDLEDLLARWFDGLLSEAEEERLDVLLRDDPAAFERFKGLLNIEGLLRAREVDPKALPARVLDSLRRRRLTSRVMDSIQHRRSKVSYAPWIAAAAVLGIAVLALAFYRPRPIASKEEVRIEIPPPAPEILPEIPPPPTNQPDAFVVPAVPAPVPKPAPRVELPPAPPAPAPKPPPPPPAPKPEPPPTVVEVRGLALLRGVSGDVKGDGKAALEGMWIQSGVETGPAGAAVLEFEDGTRIELAAETELRELRRAKGLRMTLARGVVSANVAKQPEPLSIFTPHAEARVLGTSLRLSVDKTRTALEVTEGKVRLIRSRDNKGVDVAAGQLAFDADLAPRTSAVDDILLTPRDAKLAGAEWRLLADPRASNGLALEALKSPHKPTDHVETRAAHAAFTFWARADRDYTVWVRAYSPGSGDPWLRDFLVVHPVDCKLNQPSPFFGTAPTTAFVMTGLGALNTFAWTSGEEGKAEPLRVRFQRAGFQTLRLFTGHPGIRVDALWLSATQAVKPAPRQFPRD